MIRNWIQTLNVMCKMYKWELPKSENVAFVFKSKLCFAIEPTVSEGDKVDVEQREGRILNRVVRWTEEGWEYEADQRHAEILVERLGMKEARAVATPGEEVKAELREKEQEELKDRRRDRD